MGRVRKRAPRSDERASHRGTGAGGVTRGTGGRLAVLDSLEEDGLKLSGVNELRELRVGRFDLAVNGREGDAMSATEAKA